MTTVLYSTPIPENAKTYSFGGGGRSYTAPTMGTASISRSMNAGSDGGSGNIQIGSNTSGSDALALAQQYSKNDSERMEQAFKLRDAEARRDFGFRDKESWRDFDFRTKGADQDSRLRRDEAWQQQEFRTKNADQDSALRKSEAWQQQEFRVSNANQDSGLRMKEAEQQEGFNRLLQFENNTAKERMQRWGLDHETNMFKLRDASQKESMRTAALRAARAFQGRIPTNV